MIERSTPHSAGWSRPLVLITGILFALGLVLGALTLGADVPEEPHRPEDNAIAAHLVVSAIVVAAGVLATLLTGSLRWLVSPWTRRTGARIRLTFSRRSFTGVLRCTVFVLIAALIGYLVLRMGMQVTAGLDPEFTRNAWGGPTAIGAFLAHGVDAVLCVGLAGLVAHLVLHRVETLDADDRPTTAEAGTA
ncbi:hypothetical protein [Ruania zhangjianzhongii]|uniref:hypothetical protein n=1 Tax=Ruania zhangjianzhongii TaxID=2603206 RepID=UPI0011CB7914|nr:hypothetical protein [Ruania zhangjianzhongii]